MIWNFTIIQLLSKFRPLTTSTHPPSWFWSTLKNSIYIKWFHLIRSTLYFKFNKNQLIKKQICLFTNKLSGSWKRKNYLHKFYLHSDFCPFTLVQVIRDKFNIKIFIAQVKNLILYTVSIISLQIEKKIG